MTSEEYLGKLADKFQISGAEAGSIMDAVVENMCDQLAQDHQFTIPGLGTFATTTREKRKIFDSETGQHKMMPPERVVDFQVQDKREDKDGEQE